MPNCYPTDEEEVVPHKLKKSEPEKKKVKDVVIKERFEAIIFNLVF